MIIIWHLFQEIDNLQFLKKVFYYIMIFIKDDLSYKLLFTNKSHSRIVWSVSFSHDNNFLITGSRDKKIKIFDLK
jgi:WD40 repeat protein